jgi:hypothetical protein
MAKKKKTKKSGSRRRRVSGIGGPGLQMVLGAAVGAVGGNILAEQALTRMPTLKPALVAAGQIGIGVMASRARNPLIAGVGLGLVAAGAQKVGSTFGVVSGVGSPRLVQFNSRPMLNGMENVLNGVDLDTDEDGIGEMSILAGL